MNSLPNLLALPLWLIGKTLESHSKDGGFKPELWYFFVFLIFFLVKITRNYWVIIFFVAIFGLQCQYIGKSTASNVKHSRFSRKKFAVFFRILSQSASSAYVEFLGEPPSSNNVEVCFSFLWNCTFAHFCFLSTSIWLLNFWLSPIATDYEYKSPVFKTKIAEDRFALTNLCKSSYSMDVTLLLRLN